MGMWIHTWICHPQSHCYWGLLVNVYIVENPPVIIFQTGTQWNPCFFPHLLGAVYLKVIQVFDLHNCLICPGFPWSQAPLQQEGYAAGAPAYSGGSPSFIVECSSSLTCPGGLALGVCPGSNSGMACVDCLPDHYQDGSENSRSGVG